MTQVEELLLDFNKDPQNRKLQDFYSRKAAMEIHGVARDEKAHSAFLAWLLNGKDVCVNKADSPLMWFLQVLVKREETRNAVGTVIPQPLKNEILNRTLNFTILEVTKEKPVKEVSGKFFPTKSEPDDRIDIYVKCEYSNGMLLEIFIENKVTSPEEGPKSSINLEDYDDQYQTERYYLATSGNGTNLKLYVYLRPDSLSPDSKASCTCKEFIQISYQDLLDYILIPMIQDEDLSDRSKFIIQEYIDGLSIPTLDTKRKRIVMASTQQEASDINSFVHRNLELLTLMLKALAKKRNGNSLTPDEQLLVEFAETNKNLIYATEGILGLQGRTLRLDDLYDKTDPSKPVRGFVICKPVFGIFNDSNFGYEFLKAYALYCYNTKGVNNLQDLLKSFKNDCWQTRKNSTGFYKGQTIPHFEQVPDLPYPLYALKGNWTPQRLQNITKKASWPFFTGNAL